MYILRNHCCFAILFVTIIGVHPQTVNADNSHYESLLGSPNLHETFSLRTQEEINSLTHGQGQLGDDDNPAIQYDPVMDAARVTISANDSSIAIAWQLRPTFPQLDESNSDELSIQWDARWSSDFLNVEADGLLNHKAFQISNDSQGDDRRIEFQTRFVKTDPTAVALPTIRVYGATVGGAGNSNPLSTDEDTHFNWQPGGDTHAPHNFSYGAVDHLNGGPEDNAFVMRTDIWTRFTVSITFVNNEQRLRVWMADEDTPALLVIADPSDSSLGFLTDWPTDRSGADNFWLEFNSSQETTNSALNAWVRNIVLFKDATVPFGTFGPLDQVFIHGFESQ